MFDETKVHIKGMGREKVERCANPSFGTTQRKHGQRKQ